MKASLPPPNAQAPPPPSDDNVEASQANMDQQQPPEQNAQAQVTILPSSQPPEVVSYSLTGSLFDDQQENTSEDTTPVVEDLMVDHMLQQVVHTYCTYYINY